MTDIRFAIRMLVKTPSVTIVAVVSLALGIGSTAAIFSLYSQILLRPLSVIEPGRLVNLEAPGPKPGSRSCGAAGGCDEVFSYPMFRDLQREQTVFTDIAAHRGFRVNAVWRGRAMSLRGAQVSGSYFPTLGLAPAAGRLFGPEVDEAVGGHPVVVLTHDFWESELEASPDVIGEAIGVNGQLLTIAGVGPPDFRGTTFNAPADLFVPATMRDLLSGRTGADGVLRDRRDYWVYLFARLRPDVSVEQARAAIEPLYRSLLATVEAPLQTGMDGRTLAQFLTRPLPLADGRRGQSAMHDIASVGTTLLLLLGITGAVVLIGCANVANLLLVRTVARSAEMAVRLAVGASRRRLLAQLLTESCLLALVAGAGGFVVAHWTLRLIRALVPPATAVLVQTRLDPDTAPFIVAVSLATAVLFGLAPAVHATRVNLVRTLRNHAGQPAGAGSAARFRNGLVVVQFALAMTLLVAAGLFMLSLRNVNRVDPGVRTGNVVSFRLAPAASGYGDERARALYERVDAELAAQPGVTATTATDTAVFFGAAAVRRVAIEGFEAPADAEPEVRLNRVGDDYFRTLEIPVLAGRTFAASDTRDAPRVAIVNETFARRFSLGRDAVGTRVARGGPDAEPDTEIVGIVADTTYDSPSLPAPPLLYMPYRQDDAIVRSLVFYAVSALPVDGLLRTIPGLVAALDPSLPVSDLDTLEAQARASTYESRVIALLLVSFAALATSLAAIGLYGVLAYAVAQRTREFGLRMALGADAARLRAMVLAQVGRLTLAGGGAGIAAAFGVGRVAQALLYEVEGLPLSVVAAAAAALAAVALAAAIAPARRAARVDPMAALRNV